MTFSQGSLNCVHSNLILTPHHQLQKVVKKSARREQLQREEAEQRRLKNVLELQFVLDRLGEEAVRQDLKQGAGGSPPLTDGDLAMFDEFYKLVGPERDQNVRLVKGRWRARDAQALLKLQHKSVWLVILMLAGWPTSTRKRRCTSGTCLKGKTRLWLERHVSLDQSALALHFLLSCLIIFQRNV